jgi:uncharacterized membrane protein
MKVPFVVSVLCLCTSAKAFVVPTHRSIRSDIVALRVVSPNDKFFGIIQKNDQESILETKALRQGGESEEDASNDISFVSTAAVGAVAVMLLFPETATAATVNTAIIPNALVAYGHYFFILVVMGLLTFERFTIAPNMDEETEKKLVIADATYGLSGALLFFTGYLRAVEYGKGWEFYSHEPLFWLKLTFGGILAGLSLFPTITFIKRGAPLFQGESVDPMSEKLAKRLHSIVNAEISAILSIPLLATLMARGVGYWNEFPWQAGAAVTTLALIGSGALYARQALTWSEEQEDVQETA